MYQSVAKQSLSEAVFLQLQDRIISQRLPAGEELPSERKLAELLGVNRGAVREAIKRLQQAGLIEVRHGGNSTVMNYLETSGMELLPTLLVDANGHINAAVARSIMGMRAALAPSVAAGAARKAQPALATSLRAVLSQMQQTPAGHAAALQELALDFWALLVSGSGNIAFRLAFNSMRKTYRQVWELLTLALQDEFKDFENLETIATAVQAGDRAAASAAAARHVAFGSQAMDAVLAQMDQAGAHS